MMRGHERHIEKSENKEHDRNESRLSFVVQHIDAAILMETLDRKIELLNDAFCKLFKLNQRPQDLKGKDSHDFHKELSENFLYPDKYLERISTIVTAAQPVLNEEIELVDGSIFQRDYRPAQLEDHSEHTGQLWLYKDITTLKGLEKKTNEQEAFYQKVLNNIPADITLLDKGHKYLFINQSGLSKDALREWIIGKDDFDYFLSQNKGLERAISRNKYFDQAISTGQVVQFEEKDMNADGQEITMLRHYYPYLNDKKEVEFVIGYGVNISKVKQDEQSLIQSIETYQNLIHNLDEVVFIVAADGTLKYVNPLWQQVFNKSYYESVGTPLSTFFTNEVFNRIEQDIQRIIGDLSLDKIKNELQILDCQGSVKYYQYYLSRFVGLQSDEVMVSGFIVDVTGQVNAREELLKILQKERNLSDMKTVFVNMVSHELRTPLSIIQSSAEIMELLHQQPNTQQETLKNYTSKIVGEVNNLKSLMDELLFISRIESDTLKFEASSIDVQVFITDIIQQSYAPWKDGRSLTLEVRGLARAVMVDHLMLKHIINNILDNALIYSSGKQTPELRLYFGNDHWSISCKDYGIGIPENEIEELGTSFKRGSNAGYIPGTGLGLVVVKYLTDKLKGRIQYQSTVGEGTLVRVTFPYLENK